MRFWSRLRPWLEAKASHASSRPRSTPVYPILERLEDRLAPAITTSFKAGAGVFTVRGDNLDNKITVSRSGSLIRVNSARVPVPGGFLKAAQVKSIVVNGLAGNDTITLKAGLSKGTLIGGGGHDILTGGTGADVLIGGAGDDNLYAGFGSDQLFGGPGADELLGNGGDDQMFGGNGNDYFIWSKGDGNDFIEGGAGYDNIAVGVANDLGLAFEIRNDFTVGANGNRVVVQEDNGKSFFLNIGTTEALDAGIILSGGDTVTINDLSGTEVREVHTQLDGHRTGGAVVINGTSAADAISVFGSTTFIVVVGLAVPVTINLPGADDRLTINGLGGNDTISADRNVFSILLTLDGGAGDDRINGSDGNDTLIGEDGHDIINGKGGDDLLQGGDGDDALDGGDGTDTIDGGDGTDTAANGEVVTNVP